MKRFKKITDEDFDLNSKEFNNPKIRYGARGIIFDDNNRIAILYKELKNEYKLIGGGIKENEDPIRAFKREALEEIGCKIEIDDFLGSIEEQKSQDNFKQISNVYVAHVVGNKDKPNYTEKEIGEKSKVLWYSLNDAIKLIKGCESNLISSPFDTNEYLSIYHTRFIVRRDLEILRYYKRQIS